MGDVRCDPPPGSQSGCDAEPPFQAYYTPSGKWAHMADTPIEHIVRGPPVNYDDDGESPEQFFAKGLAKGALVPFVCKKYDVWRNWSGFHTEMFLLASSSHLRTFQGSYVPSVISVQSAPGGYLMVNFEPMSRKGWTDAHPQLTSPYLKGHIINAYTKIHAQGILHGDVSLRNIIVEQRGGKVHILNFQKARALVPLPNVGLAACTPAELEFEMRHVKFIIDSHGAQKREEALWVGSGPESETAWNKNNALRSKRSPNRMVPGPREVWDVEKRQWRAFDTRNTWFPIREPKASRAAILPKTFLEDCVPDNDEWLDTVAELVEADARQHQIRERRYRLERIRSHSPYATPLDAISSPSPTFSEALLPSPVVADPWRKASVTASPSLSSHGLPSLPDDELLQRKREQLLAIDAAIWAQKGEAEEVIKSKSSHLLQAIQGLEQSDLDELIIHAKSHESSRRRQLSGSTLNVTSFSGREPGGPGATSRSETPAGSSQTQSPASRRPLRPLRLRDQHPLPAHRVSNDRYRPPSSPKESSLRQPSHSRTIRYRPSFSSPWSASGSAMLPPAARPSSSSTRDSRIRRSRSLGGISGQSEATATRRGDSVLSSSDSFRDRTRAPNANRPLVRDPNAGTDHDLHRAPVTLSSAESPKETVATPPQAGNRNLKSKAYSSPVIGRRTDASIDQAVLPSMHRATSSSPSYSSSEDEAEEYEVEAILSEDLELEDPVDATTSHDAESSASERILEPRLLPAAGSSSALSSYNPCNNVGSVTSRRKRDHDCASDDPHATEDWLPYDTDARKRNDEPAIKRIRLASAFLNSFNLRR
ncbi:hypothetical protein BS47DRAFT_767479 [Hydnum rufescens UP504]|uniref:Uncharacterized protein n=1 Tax=Hydnum rufescens UP504 TaxID=1448309 RepID=A0A9P6B3D9_9AGAM|nr:hypothetical protein BS47DRAFT_767479 [Hydnum rufescens UP504]